MTTALAVLSVACVLLYAVGMIGIIVGGAPVWWTRIALAAAGLAGALCLAGFGWIMAGAV
jgi:hypothetical protein